MSYPQSVARLRDLLWRVTSCLWLEHQWDSPVPTPKMIGLHQIHTRTCTRCGLQERFL